MTAKFSTDSVDRLPDWRFKAVVQPDGANLRRFRSRPVHNKGGLRRYLASANLQYRSSLSYSDEFKRILGSLPVHARRQFDIVERKKLQADSKTRLEVRPQSGDQTTWSARTLPAVKDRWLRRLIAHISQLQPDRHIALALLWVEDADKREMLKNFGFGVYAGLSDTELQTDWSMNLQEVGAIRNLFFDFSKAPKGAVPRMAYLRQLNNSRHVDTATMRVMQRIDELGKLGYYTIAGTGSMVEEDRKKLQQYLRNSTYGTVIDLKFQAVTFQEASRLPGIVTDLLFQEKAAREVILTDAKTKNLEASTKKIETTTGDQTKEDVFNTMDYENLELVTRMQEFDPQVSQLKTILDLQKPVET